MHSMCYDYNGSVTQMHHDLHWQSLGNDISTVVAYQWCSKSTSSSWTSTSHLTYPSHDLLYDLLRGVWNACYYYIIIIWGHTRVSCNITVASMFMQTCFSLTQSLTGILCHRTALVWSSSGRWRWLARRHCRLKNCRLLFDMLLCVVIGCGR